MDERFGQPASAAAEAAQVPWLNAAEAEFDTQRMADGTCLTRRHWPCPQAERGVLLVHGLGEHSGRYRHVAAWFHARGWDVRAYDQRGHGLSEGRRGALRHRDDLPRDLAEVYGDYARCFSRAPLLVGHSMGGLVVARAVLEGRVRPSAVVLSSPALRSWVRWPLRTLAGLLAYLLPNLPLASRLPPGDSSHDPVVAAAARTDPLCSTRVTPRLGHFIFHAGRRCLAEAAALDIPMLLLAAGQDHHVDPAGSRIFAARASECVQLAVFESLYHELFNEAEPARSQVMQRLASWLDSVAPNG